ncbi:MAG: hypothetical protein U1F43_30965 [Myxococcota bacterium]
MSHKAPSRIWLFAFGYFASYAPYSLITKRVTSGLATGVHWSGVSILPLATIASTIGMIIFTTSMRWWPYATHSQLGRFSIPRPRLVTFMSGVATAAILLTTTLAYTFEGISILFVMLLMRGGVLLLAPMIDRLGGRTFKSIPWWSWAGSGLSLAALVVAFAPAGGSELTVPAGVVVLVYLGGYFFRLRWMSSQAKFEGPDVRERRLRFFVEEQMVATPLAVLVLAIAATTPTGIGHDLREGFAGFGGDVPTILWVVLAGICSQGSGAFGALVLLEPQENAYTVPVNRAASVLAGVVASFALTLFGEAALPDAAELAGAAIIILAIAVLAWPVWQRRAARLAAARA